jgi:SagB-type dehydrogenase family enzyme
LAGEPDQSKGVPQPPLEMNVTAQESIALPFPENATLLGISLKEAIRNRISCRNFSEETINISELSYLLWSTQGVKKVREKNGFSATFRTVPSAGARHALETFLIINKVEGISTGIYKYEAVRHCLSLIKSGDEINDTAYTICLEQEMVKTASVVFVWVAFPYRMTWRYHERGYRYILLDAGHACQNLYLSAQDINCGVCAIAALDDDQMDNLLNLDKNIQFSIYLAALGKTKEEMQR